VSQEIVLRNGRVLTVGSRWRSNDLRRLRAVEIASINIERRTVVARNVLSLKETTISFDAFTTGVRGWSRL
jgi:hypothetical protein